jgi:exonuclease-1
MGIEGLQALLGPIERQMHLKDYAGKTVAIDGLYILHHSNNGATTPLIKGTSTNT